MSIKPSTPSKVSPILTFKHAIHGSIPFVASLGLLTLSWFNKQTWILWQTVLLAALVLLPPYWYKLRQQRLSLPSLSQSFFLFLIGFHLQVVCQGVGSIYLATAIEPLSLWQNQTLGILFCSALSYHNSLKEKALSRGSAPLSCWAFPSETASIRRLILFLSHYAAANGLLCFFIVIIIFNIQYFCPEWWSKSLNAPIPVFCAIFLIVIGLSKYLCSYHSIDTFLAKHSLAYTTFFFLLSITILTLLSSIVMPQSLIESIEILNWMNTIVATSSSGQTLTYGTALGSTSLFLLGLLTMTKISLSNKQKKILLIVEFGLWAVILVSFLSFSHFYEKSYSLASIQYYVLHASARYDHLNHPLGIILLSLPLYSGLIRRFSSKATSYLFVFTGFIFPLPQWLPQPQSTLLLLLSLILGNLLQSRHIIYACDAPWEPCHRSLIKANRWIFPISFAIAALFLASFLLKRGVCLIVVENFGLLFLISLILIAFLEAFLKLEQTIKSWYSMRNFTPSLATT